MRTWQADYCLRWNHLFHSPQLLLSRLFSPLRISNPGPKITEVKAAIDCYNQFFVYVSTGSCLVSPWSPPTTNWLEHTPSIPWMVCVTPEYYLSTNVQFRPFICHAGCTCTWAVQIGFPFVLPCPQESKASPIMSPLYTCSLFLMFSLWLTEKRASIPTCLKPSSEANISIGKHTPTLISQIDLISASAVLVSQGEQWSDESKPNLQHQPCSQVLTC